MLGTSHLYKLLQHCYLKAET